MDIETLARAQRPLPFVAAVDLVKRFFGGTVLERVSLSLRPGEVCALLGENGAGKSSVINLPWGVFAAEAGTIEVDGVAVGLAKALKGQGVTVSNIAVSAKIDEESFQSGEARRSHLSEEQLASALTAAFPESRRVRGTPAFFTEFNRKRPNPAQAEYLTFTTTPVVHTADEAPVVETLQSLPHILHSARIISKGVPLAIGPVGIGARLNPYSRSRQRIFSNEEGVERASRRSREWRLSRAGGTETERGDQGHRRGRPRTRHDRPFRSRCLSCRVLVQTLQKTPAEAMRAAHQ